MDGTVKEQRATDFGDGSDGALSNCVVVMTAGTCQLMNLSKGRQLLCKLMRGKGGALVGNIAGPYLLCTTTLPPLHNIRLWNL